LAKELSNILAKEKHSIPLENPLENNESDDVSEKEKRHNIDNYSVSIGDPRLTKGELVYFSGAFGIVLWF